MQNVKCRYCGETIKSEAIKCRFCGEWLNKKHLTLKLTGIWPSLIIIGILIAASCYLGFILIKSNETTKSIKSSNSSAEITIPTDTPIIIPMKSNDNNYVAPKVIQPTNSPIPQRKLVQVTLSDSQISGTYYCYEDKANVIMNTQTSLNVAIKVFNVCSDTKSNPASICISNCGFTAQSCISSCYGSQDMTTCTNNCTNQSNSCYDSCPKAPTCNLGDIDNLRSQLRQQIHDNCP